MAAAFLAMNQGIEHRGGARRRGMGTAAGRLARTGSGTFEGTACAAALRSGRITAISQ
jgi:hypothetical protein